MTLQLVSEETQLILQQYEQDLLSYVDIRDEIKKDFALNVIFDRYQGVLGFSPNKIKAHAALINRPREDDREERRVYSLSELIAMHNTLPQWLVPNLIGSGGGLYMVSGRPKAGKTLIFGYQLAYSIAVSGEFLGLPCQKGKVMFFECEEPMPTIVKRLRTKGFNNNFQGMDRAINDNLISLEREFKIDADLTYLRERVEEYQPSIVIYDSLRRITAHLGESENDARFASYIYTLQAVHNVLGVPGLIIHHNNKSGEGLNGVSGSGGIPGATDGVILLNPLPDSGHVVELETVPREGIPVHYKVQRQKDSHGFWTYQITEMIGVTPEVLKWEKRIIRHLSGNLETKYTKSSLARELQTEVGFSAFSAALERLAESYQIGEDFTSSGTQEYWMSSVSPWVNLEGTSLSTEIQDVQKLLGCTSAEEVTSLNNSWGAKGDEYKRRIWDLLSDTEKIRVRELINPRVFSNGQWVRLKETHEAHKVVSAEFFVNEDQWVYNVEGTEQTFFESELEAHPDYVSYSTEF